MSSPRPVSPLPSDKYSDNTSIEYSRDSTKDRSDLSNFDRSVEPLASSLQAPASIRPVGRVVTPGVIVRRYAVSDREKVRQLCCETGFLGRDIAPVFEDRELFADYLTRYYTDVEPESSFVLEQHGVIKGYLLGSRSPLRQQQFSFFNNIRLFLRGMSRYPRYNRPTRDFIGWILRNSWREVPAAPRRSAHFHFNILPEAQGLAHSTALMNAYLDYLRDVGVTSVYGQVVTFETRRGARVFERYGFQVLERKEITKYRKIYPEPVYLTTVLMELSPREKIAMRPS